MNKESKKAQIIDISWDLLQKEGIDGFSMRKLSAASNTSISSLYHYYKNKESIFQAMVDKALAEVVFPVNANGVDDKLKQYAYNILSTLKKYPNLEWLLLVYPPTQVNYTKLLDNLLMIVDGLDIKREQKLYYINIFINFILTFQIDRQIQIDDQAKNNRHNESSWNHSIAPYLNYYYKNNIIEKLSEEEVFDFGISLLINGLKTK
ncbi:TetR/AcrR family transcriptional regulator [Mammaliicoccus sciuri]|uniref:TetR/AcrR family transcriptional regulator n=1 Tax=Mammaliicoccus sciuri TaxID=1296 RepID=UPI001E4CC6E0|nr:TetR/AcrR family transcriptional regulator [Mammaliicoccus sciuri]MCD8761912.1 TetR/AcrR family transcriptional regulator [Mammaliicoccus sciuri]MCD8837197.1 TetR/AcrR family transcriptional regulator [Mammaliicoccus sciuri]MEB6118562.1 TetR/AcrR family transcriptional regulator [Mammaliicoccus sciuri]MEB6207410.1 TetR/AcrR family transcriptional regulator [Mammaliicoccus sciuri]MEB7397260.1 TetR/AcrR family transcriptional regulator [Mammaliicoccus sciuri]